MFLENCISVANLCEHNCRIELYAGSNMILSSKTLTESGIEVSVDSTDIRGGLSAPVIGKYFHGSSFNLNLTDATFSLEYLALNCGGNITIGGESMVDETITTTAANAITVAGVPQDWSGLGNVGWYTLAGQNDYRPITFVGQTATVDNLPVGTNVCVRYFGHYDNMREFIVPSAIIPAECHAILTAPLFSADSKNFTASSKVADLVIDIPRFMLNGAQSFSMTMDGAATTSLAGSALAVYDDSCDQTGYYAKIKEIHYSGSVYDTLRYMAVNDYDIELAQGETMPITVTGIYQGGATGIIPAADLTFTSASQAVATVADGVVTAVGNGNTTITIALTSNPAIGCYANVTVG